MINEIGCNCVNEIDCNCVDFYLSLESDEKSKSEPTTDRTSGNLIGRKKKIFNAIIEPLFEPLFESLCTDPPSKSIKLDNLTAFLIRRLKKIFNDMANNKITSSQKFGFDTLNPTHMKIWFKLNEIYLEHQKSVQALCKFKLMKNPKRSAAKRFFKNVAAKNSFYLMLDLLFPINAHPEEICAKFKFRCCKEIHDPDICTQKWKTLELYLRHDYFEWLDEADAQSD